MSWPRGTQDYGNPFNRSCKTPNLLINFTQLKEFLLEQRIFCGMGILRADSHCLEI